MLRQPQAPFLEEGGRGSGGVRRAWESGRARAAIRYHGLGASRRRGGRCERTKSRPSGCCRKLCTGGRAREMRSWRRLRHRRRLDWARSFAPGASRGCFALPLAGEYEGGACRCWRAQDRHRPGRRASTPDLWAKREFALELAPIRVSLLSAAWMRGRAAVRRCERFKASPAHISQPTSAERVRHVGSGPQVPGHRQVPSAPLVGQHLRIN